jgi:FAD/FMN-containing dehydrogenase
MATATELHGLEELQAQVRGDVIDPGDPRYEGARQVYNAMIDKHPALIVACRDVADVQAALAYARANGLDVAIRGAGHNGAGLGTVDDGLVIDLSPMRWTRVDPAARTVQAGGGCQLGDVDHATHAFGLATPVGILASTGMGLPLGGGVGYLTRKYGLTIDNIVDADLVLADGSFVHASEDENDDLFWAIRGGGGNFGVVTALTFRLHPVSTVVAGPMLWPLDRAAEILQWYREFIVNAPDDVNGFFAFITVPPGPPFPEELHLQKMCAVVWSCTGPEDAAAAALAPARELAPVLDGVMTVPLPAMNSAFDALYPAGDQWYWRGDFIAEIPDAAIEKHVEFAENLPTWKSTMHLYPIDGATSRVPNDATPWAYREAKWAAVYGGVDPDPANAELIRSWTVDYFDAIHPHSMGGSYVNFMGTDEGQDRVQATYRGNYARLAEIKAKVDPDNVFHVNQNIQPAS